MKQHLTEQRKQHITASMIKIAVLGKLIQIEHAMDLDVKFSKPEINRFAGRILTDAISIQQHLAADGKVSLKFIGHDPVDEFAGELHRVIQYFISLDVNQIKEFMDGVETLKESEVKY